MYKDCLTAALRTVASNGWQNQISVASTFNSIFSTNVSVANRYVKCISLNEYRLTADRSICTVDVNPFWAQKGRFPAECCHDMWCGKTRMVCLPDAEKFLKICLFVLTWSTNVTAQTDTETDTAWRHRSRLHDNSYNDVNDSEYSCSGNGIRRWILCLCCFYTGYLQRYSDYVAKGRFPLIPGV